MNNNLQIIKIYESKIENKDIKTFIFKYKKEIKPGQFFMIWIPNVDEIPMSVSYDYKDLKGITFKRVGEATNALFEMDVGDKIGVRGPYGNGFDISGKKILFVGGGTGIVNLVLAVEEAENLNINSTVIIGVKKRSEVIFKDRFKKCGAEVYVSSEDGSEGFKGLATDLARKLFKKKNFSSILTCGPEIMMKNLLEYCENLHFQASLERYMKCSVGICSQCCIGNGLRVCMDGPIFDGETLKNIEEFGVYRRDASGRKIRFV
jgi:dihydroorotate dehydrogenase electron transfer subunit